MNEQTLNVPYSLLGRLLLIAIVMANTTGCYDRADLEDQTSGFLVGFDLDQENNMIIYTSNPVFSKEVEKRSQEYNVTARTLRQSRAKLEAQTLGFLNYRKIQIVLLGKRFLQHEDWYAMVDVILRDTKNSLTQRMIVYGGPLSDIIPFREKDQPMLPLLLRGMVDTKSDRSETVKTTFLELDRQMYEKGVTPYISEVDMNKENEIALYGTALLDKKGKYVASLDMPESVCLQILQKKVEKPASLTLHIAGETKTGPFDTDRVSIVAERIKTKIRTSYRQGKFTFDIAVQMPVSLSERLFPFDVRKQGKQLEKKIAEQVQLKLENLLRKIQEHRIDPIGLGLYARAYEYGEFKKVQNHWGEALAQADIRVDVKVTIGSMGPVK